MSERVADLLGIAYDRASLKKVKGTPELKSMTDIDERKKALADAVALTRR